MYKLVLVDDEQIVLNGIQAVFNLQKYGISVVGAYNNPLTALSDLPKTQPDVIITDIKMPQMDGLEFAYRARKQLPETEIVILTGYDDFEFAQTAIRIGVTDYLLKPIKKQKFEEMIASVTRSLREKNAFNEGYQLLSQTVQDNFSLIKNSFFLGLISGSIELKQCQEQYNILGLAFREFEYAIIKFVYKNLDPGNKRHEIVGILSSTVGKVLKESGCIEVFSNDESVYFLWYDFKLGLSEMQKKITSVLTEIRNISGFEFAAAISNPHKGFDEFFTAGIECDTSLLNSLNCSQNECLLSAESNRFPSNLNFDLFNAKFENLSISISVREKEKAVQIIHDIFDSVQEISNTDYCYSISLIILLKLLDIQIKLNPDSKLIIPSEISIDYLKRNYQSVQMLKQFIIETTCKLVDEIDEHGKLYISKITAAAIHYINEHYSENISLSDIANQIFVSKNYLCHIFRKEMNTTPINYLAKIRIEKAKELVKGNRFKMYQISLMVGYPDYAYFSQLFKKITGLTLSEFKNNL